MSDRFINLVMVGVLLFFIFYLESVHRSINSGGKLKPLKGVFFSKFKPQKSLGQISLFNKAVGNNLFHQIITTLLSPIRKLQKKNLGIKEALYFPSFP